MSHEQGVEISVKEKKDRSDGNKSLLRGGLVHDVDLRQIIIIMCLILWFVIVFLSSL